MSADAVVPTANDNRRPVIKRNIRTNEDEARWLEEAIIMRAEEGLATLGLNVKWRSKGMYDLLLLSLNAATKRGHRARTEAGSDSDER